MKKCMNILRTGLLIAACVMNTGLFAAMGGAAPAPTADEQLYRSIQVVMEEGNLDLIKKFIKNAKLDVKAQYGLFKDTLLSIAAKAGNRDAVDYLIAQKSDVNAVNDLGESVLIAALRYNPDASEGFLTEEEWDKEEAILELSIAQEEEIFKKLSSKRSLGGAETLIQDFLYESPAAIIVKRLLAAGADARAIITVPHTTPVETNTALHVAAEQGNIEAVNMLIAAGADVNYATLPYQLTPLLVTHYVTVYKALLEAGADVNAHGVKNRTALMLAALCDHCGNVKNDVLVLLRAGADVTLKDKYGKTVFDYAKRKPEILELLKKYAPYSQETKANEAWAKEHKEAVEGASEVEEPAFLEIDDEKPE